MSISHNVLEILRGDKWFLIQQLCVLMVYTRIANVEWEEEENCPLFCLGGGPTLFDNLHKE